MIAKLQLFELETVLDIQNKEIEWLSLFFRRISNVGKKEGKSGGKLCRKHWFCMRRITSAGPHDRPRSTPGSVIRHKVYSYWLEWDVCKSPGFPSNRVAAGQVDPPAVRITMVCSLFACCLSASEAFLFLSGAICWVLSNAYTIRKNICWFFRG